MSETCNGNCEGCPEVVYALGLIEAMDNISHKIETAAIDDKIDSAVAPAIYEDIKRAGVTGLDIEGMETIKTPEDIARGIRIEASKTLDEVEEKKALTEKNLGRLTQGCLGPLKMRANKAGRTVTVKVCNSPLAPEGTMPGMVDVTRSWD